MDFALTESEEMLRQSARSYLEEASSEAHVREMQQDPVGYSKLLWSRMADLGWHGMCIPADEGGGGGAFTDVRILAEELGRALVPGPFITNLISTCALLLSTDRGQRGRFLSDIASGAAVHTLALTEQAARWDPDGVSLLATPDGGGFRLSGYKKFVPHAHVADFLHIIAWMPGGGLGDFIVPRRRDGIVVSPFRTISGERQSVIELDSVFAESIDVIELDNQRFEMLRDMAICIESAYLLGAASRDFEITLSYAKERQQFGRPIGTFQAIQHRAADMLTELDGMRLLVDSAAWCIEHDLERRGLLAAMAKAWCSAASRRIVAAGQQIHGAIGFSEESQIQLYYKAQKRAECSWGTAEFHRERIADLVVPSPSEGG